MVRFSPSDIAFIKKNFDNFEELIQIDRVDDILHPIDRLILLKGYKSDYEELNAWGKQAKRVHDNIYSNN